MGVGAFEALRHMKALITAVGLALAAWWLAAWTATEIVAGTAETVIRVAEAVSAVRG